MLDMRISCFQGGVKKTGQAKRHLNDTQVSWAGWVQMEPHELFVHRGWAKPGWHIPYSEQTTDRTAQVLNLGKEFFSSPKITDQLWE